MSTSYTPIAPNLTPIIINVCPVSPEVYRAAYKAQKIAGLEYDSVTPHAQANDADRWAVQYAAWKEAYIRPMHLADAK